MIQLCGPEIDGASRRDRRSSEPLILLSLQERQSVRQTLHCVTGRTDQEPNQLSPLRGLRSRTGLLLDHLTALLGRLCEEGRS